MYQISRFTLTACICLVLLACVSTDDLPAGPLAGKKSIVLMGNKGEKLAIGTVLFTPTDNSDRVSYTIDIDYALFTDYFLSMKEMKCLEGPELWCHLRYPYEQPRTVTTTDLSWLSHDLLFMFKKKGEFGANFWNGIYYEFDVRDGAIYGKAQAVDLNLLAAPPDDLAIPPFSAFERSETESAPRFLPFVEIR